MRVTHDKGWMATVILGQNYNFTFDNAPHLTNISYRYANRKEFHYVGSGKTLCMPFLNFFFLVACPNIKKNNCFIG